MGSLHDAYELGGIAGHGRTTVVRLAVRRGDCRPVALKQLRMEHAVDPGKRGRFIRQVRRARVLEHDHIEELLDLVEGDDGPVAVSGWIDGRSLLRLIQWRRDRAEPWDPVEVTVIARGVLEALRYAHRQPGFDAEGMLHGGLWPGNVLLNIDGDVKVVDFGMSAVWQDPSEPWQDIEALRYLSVDHMRHGPSAASDLYAVGALVHELLSAERFRGHCETEAQMRAAVEQLEPPPRPPGQIPTQLELLRRRLLEPVPTPHMTLEHMLDLCAALPTTDGRERLSAVVRRALRSDPATGHSRAMPSPEPAPGADSDPESDARARARRATITNFEAGSGLALTLPPMGLRPETAAAAQIPHDARRDTQSVPVPVHHEQTAARSPMFLKQTAPARGEQTRTAEQRRSGEDEASEASPPDQTDAAGVPRTVPRRISDELLEPGVTAEVAKIAQLPEDEAPPTIPTPREQASRSAGLRSHLRGPMGWALLGALLVGVGVPLVTRCGGSPPAASPDSP